ncbi:MAG: NAD-binding protein [Fuerstiella sp.]
MQSSVQKVLIGATVFTLSCIVAIVGYMLAGWSILEAVYMVTITIFGVGYGEVRPIDDPGLRVFTMGVIIAGCTSSIYVMGGFVQMIAEGELNRFLGARRMTRGIDKLTNHVIVCGFGRVGRILADELSQSDLEFVIVDTNQERLQEAETAGLFVLVGDATDEDVLEAAGIARAKVLATVLPDDAANVFITLTARELNPHIEIIARGESPSTEKKLLRSGATKVVLPAAIGASRIARLITRPSAEKLLSESLQLETLMQDLEQIGLHVTELRVPANSEFAGQRLNDISFGDVAQFVVIAVRSVDGRTVSDPGSDYVLMADDTLVLLAHRGTELKLLKKSGASEIVYRGVRASS